MAMMDTLRAEPVQTADRIAIAWADAHPVLRRMLVAACVTAVALSTIAPAAPTVRWAAGITGTLLALAALVDVHQHRLPNQLLAMALCSSLVGVLIAQDGVVLASSLMGMCVAGGLMLLVRLTRGVGMGDVKMAAVVGASTGAYGLVLAPVAIAVAALAAAVFGALTRRRRVPLGPALWAGWAIALTTVAVRWTS